MISGATQSAFKFLFEHIKVPEDVEIHYLPKELLESNRKIKILWAHYNCDQQIYLNTDWEKITHIVCVSNWEKEQFVKYIKIPEEKITVIRNGGADYFQPSNKKTKTLIYTSTPFRGLKNLLYIFPKVLEKHPDAKLKIFSGMNLYGEQNDEFEPIYDELKKIKNVEYSKAIDHKELVKHYQESAIFCYPNNWEETSCVSLIESMRCGCYPILSNIGALPETSHGFGSIVEMKGVNTPSGWIPDKQFLDNFAEEVCRVLTIYSYNEEISKFSCEYYDWKIISKEWEKLFLELKKEKNTMKDDIKKFVGKTPFEIADDVSFVQMAYNQVFKWENEDKEHAQGRSNFQIEKFIALDNFTIASSFNALLKNRRAVAEGLLTKIIEVTKKKRDFDRKWEKDLKEKTEQELKDMDYDLDVIQYETFMKNSELEIRDRTQQMDFFDKLLDKLVEMNGGPITKEQFEKEDQIYWERRFANQAYDEIVSRVTGINPGNIHSMRRATAPTLLEDDVNRVKNGYPDLSKALSDEGRSEFMLELQKKVVEGIIEVTGKGLNQLTHEKPKEELKLENQTSPISPKKLFNEVMYTQR